MTQYTCEASCTAASGSLECTYHGTPIPGPYEIRVKGGQNVIALDPPTGKGAIRHGTILLLVGQATWLTAPVIASRWVDANSQYEPETRNQIGGLGAYRDIPDNAGIKKARAALLELAAQLGIEVRNTAALGV